MSEQAMRLVSSASERQPVHVGILGSDGTLLFANCPWREFGERVDSPIRPATLQSNYCDRLRGSSDPAAQSIARALSRVLDGEATTAETGYSHTAVNRTYQFRLRAHQFTLADEGYVAVTHVETTEEAGDREQAGFRQAIEAAGHAIFITNMDGEITYVNPAFEQITGYEAHEALGRTPGILNSGEMGEEYFERLWATILDGEVWEELVINRRKSGELYYAHQTIAPVLGDDGEPVEFVALQTDITELRATRQSTAKLGRILRHDLRNELSVARSYAELIEQRGGEVATYAEKIVETISDLLETSEKGIKLQRFLSQTHQPEPTDVAGVVETVVSDARTVYPDAEVTATGTETAIALCLDEIEVALMELVENAVVHNDSETPRADVAVETSDDWVEIRVTDNGTGLPEMEYESLDSTSSDLYHDTGFGLNLAYWIVRRSGGSFEFEKREGDGTVITVTLPKPAR